MASFAQLLRAKELNLNLTALLVKAFLDEQGPTPVGLIARACATSVRSVERAIALLKGQGLLSLETTNLSHDHVSQAFNQPKRTAPSLAADSAKPDASSGTPLNSMGSERALQADSAAPAPAAKADAPKPAASPVAAASRAAAQTTAAAPEAAKPVHVDPLGQQLLDCEVLPWCVDLLLSKVERAVIERQLAYHAHRQASGFRFKGHPARYLFSACLNDYQAPQDFFSTQHRQREGLVSAEPAPQVAPIEAPKQELTRDGALTIIRLGLRSKLPHLRDEAHRLAAEWGINVASLAG